MKNILVALLSLVCAVANAQFSPGQVLTASQLNTQFALYVPIAGGTLTGPLTVPSLSVTGSPISLASGGTGATTASQAISNIGGLPLVGGTLSGALSLGYTGARLAVNDTSGSGVPGYVIQNNGTNEWAFVNAGANGNLLNLNRYVGGTLTDQPISVNNSTGVVSFADGLTANANNEAILMQTSVTGTNSHVALPFYVQNSYDGNIVSNYQAGLINVRQGISYGYNNASATGSAGFIAGAISVANADNGGGGRTEFTPWSSNVVPVIGGNITGGQNFYMDDLMETNTNTSSDFQEGFLAGHQIAVQKWVPGNTLDANHNGSWGTVITTDPQNIGYDTQNRSGYSTYPMNAMLQLSGWSGANSVTSGSAIGATPAAAVGLQVGGPVGSTWAPVTSRSYIPIGIDVQDYTTAGIRIENPHSGGAGIAINTVSGAGTINASDGLNTFGPIVAAYPNARFFANDTSGTGAPGFEIQNVGTNAWGLVNNSSNNALNLNRYVGGKLTDQPISVSNSTGMVSFVDGISVSGTTVEPNFSGTTGSIGGSALTAGACTSGTVAVANSTTSMAVVATPATYPGDGIFWHGYVSAAGTVTVKVCASVAATPTASAYNVRVLQ